MKVGKGHFGKKSKNRAYKGISDFENLNNLNNLNKSQPMPDLKSHTDPTKMKKNKKGKRKKKRKLKRAMTSTNKPYKVSSDFENYVRKEETKTVKTKERVKYFDRRRRSNARSETMDVAKIKLLSKRIRMRRGFIKGRTIKTSRRIYHNS